MSISPEQIDQLIASGEAEYLGTVGIFSRPVYRIGGQVYRQVLRFTEGEYVPGEFYAVRNEKAVLSILVKEGE